MPKSFPCPYCKGKGSWVEPVLDDGSGPMYNCGACSGKGMIEIGSADHQALKDANPPNWLMWEMLAEKSYALDKVIDALEKLGLDGWSDAPHLMQVCRKAQAFPREPK